MKVLLGSKKFTVGWKHTEPEALIRSTFCLIQEVLPDNTLKVISQGEAHCSFFDCYNRNTGRKLSLERALLAEAPDPVNPKNWLPLFVKEDRSSVWQEYFKMRGGKW